MHSSIISLQAAYDKVLKAREAVKLRNEVLDSRRKKLKEDLEEKERLAEQSSARHTAEEQLQVISIKLVNICGLNVDIAEKC